MKPVLHACTCPTFYCGTNSELYLFFQTALVNFESEIFACKFCIELAKSVVLSKFIKQHASEACYVVEDKLEVSRFQASFRIRGAEEFDSPWPQRYVTVTAAAKLWRVSY